MAGKDTKAELIDALQSTRILSCKDVHNFIDALLEELKGQSSPARPSSFADSAPSR